MVTKVRTVSEGKSGANMNLPDVEIKATNKAIVIAIPLSKGQVIANSRGYKNRFYANIGGYKNGVETGVYINDKPLYGKLSFWTHEETERGNGNSHPGFIVK